MGQMCETRLPPPPQVYVCHNREKAACKYVSVGGKMKKTKTGSHESTTRLLLSSGGGQGGVEGGGRGGGGGGAGRGGAAAAAVHPEADREGAGGEGKS